MIDVVSRNEALLPETSSSQEEKNELDSLFRKSVNVEKSDFKIRSAQKNLDEDLQKVVEAVENLLKKIQGDKRKLRKIARVLGSELEKKFKENGLKSSDSCSTCSPRFNRADRFDSRFYSEFRILLSEIREIIKDYRDRCEVAEKVSEVAQRLIACANSCQDRVFALDPCSVQPVSEGIGGTYFLKDPEGNILLVAKPNDEEAGCINNPKGNSGMGMVSSVRDHMPLYRLAMKEVFVYRFAKELGVESVVPKTDFALLESKRFYYFDRENRKFDLEKVKECGPIPSEKLCSVQEFIPRAISLAEVQELMALKKEIEIDQQQFEDVNLLIWAIYDTDAHSHNILAVVLSRDEDGKVVYGLKKIDNGYAFPGTNSGLRNALNFLPNAEKPLSEQGKEKLRNLDADAIAEKMKECGLEYAIPAFRARIAFLKTLTLEPNITFKQIDRRLRENEFPRVNVPSGNPSGS